MTASGFEAALPVLALLPTCCDRRRSLVPESSGTGRGGGPLAKIWSLLVNTTFTTSGYCGVDCAVGVGGCGCVCGGAGGAADVGAAERTLGQRTGHRGEGDAAGPLLNDLRLLLIHKDADAAASDQRGFIGKFVLCLQLIVAFSYDFDCQFGHGIFGVLLVGFGFGVEVVCLFGWT